MRSIALYYKYKDEDPNEKLEPEDKNNKEKLEFHINIWKVERGRYRLKPKLYFDFGIKAKFKVGKLCLYLPFEIDESEFKDLGKVLYNQKDLLSTIFNDEMCTKTLSNDCYCEVGHYNSDEKFYLYQLGSLNKEITSSEEEGDTKGTYIELTINGKPDDNNTINDDEFFYVRFRVKVKNIDQVVITQHLSNDLLQAAFSKTDLYDIRINELREVHPKISEKMKVEKYRICSFSKIHIFYMADVHEVIENGSSLKQDSRILEDKKWCSYEPRTDLHNSIFIAHHWKRREKNNEDNNDNKNNNDNKLDKGISSFNLFFSTVYPETQFLRLFVYIMFVIGLGFLGSMLSFSLNDVDNGIPYTKIKKSIALFIFLLIFIYVLCSNFGYKIGNIFRKR